MKTLEIDTTTLNAEEKSIIKKGIEQYSRGDFQNARNSFLSVYQQDTNPRGLQLGIGLCLIKMNKKRQGRLFVYKELLDYPDNKTAQNVHAHQNGLVNGKIIQHVFTDVKRPEVYPDISLVLIVKNEEKDLGRCLESFRDIVKEIIVVDTGSTDRTVEIAKSFGARVEYYEWTNDFATARNESLKYATCEWILRTDADEYIEDSEKAKLLTCINSGLADIYICPTISKTKKGEEVVENVRLIKNHLGVEYHYPIHETIILSVVRQGLTQCLVNVNFQHTGYVDVDGNTLVNKIKRNVAVCEKFLLEHPDDYYVRLIRDLSLMDGSKKESMINDMEQVVNDLPENALSVRYLGLAYIMLLTKYMKEKREIELINILHDIQIHFTATNSIMQLVGEIYLYVRGDWKKANKVFNWNAKRLSNSMVFADYLPIEKYNQRENLSFLAETQVLNKEYDKSRKTFLLALKNEDSASDVQVIELQKQFSKLKETELRSLAKSLIEKKEWNDAYKAIIWAASKSQLNFQDYADLAYCQIQLKNLRFAHMLIEEAKGLDFESPIIMNLESLIELNENHPDKAFEKALNAFIRNPANAGYQNNVEQISSILGLSPVEAIKKTGLGWIKEGKVKDGLFALIIYLKFKPDDEEIKKIISKYSG